MSLNESTAVPLSSSDTLPTRWAKQDTIWMLSLYGTAIGAGVLFLPINAGLHGIWPLIIMAIIAFPLTYYSHQALCRLVLSGSSIQADITGVVEEHFGRFLGKILTGLYFFAIYPFLLMYSVAITNTTESFIVNQLGFNAPPRAVLSIVLILAIMTIIQGGQKLMIKTMSFLVYPFAGILLFLSFYLIPYWNSAIFESNNLIPSHGLLTTLWLIIPVMVFCFNHSPIISSFAVAHKQEFGHQADERCNNIMKYGHLMMVFSVMFFVFSCVFSLSPQDLIQAKQQNISILSYLANHFKTPLLAYIAPFVAFVAIFKSFLGHYMGAKEGLVSIIKTFNPKNDLKKNTHQRLVELFIVLTCWLAATINPNILKMIETLGGPVIALLLFILPMYAMVKVPALKPYANKLSNVFVTLIGLITLASLVYGLI